MNNNKENINDFLFYDDTNVSSIFSYSSLLVTPKINKKIIQENVAEEITLTPLEPGLGITIGNSLRRVLLSHMGGYAISAVKITGATHKFQNVNGIVENVSDILMNLKEVVIAVNEKENIPSFFGVIEVQGPGDVYAKDLKIDYGTIINPDHFICSLDTNGSFYAKVLITYGRGYVEAEDQYFQNTNSDEDQFLETALIMDCTYNHIKKVEYHVEQTRVNEKNNYDKLILKIETSGAITPVKALGSAYYILMQQMGILRDLPNAEIEVTEAPKQAVENNIPEYMFFSINKIGLPDRVQNTLELNNIRYVGDLVTKTESELLRLQRMGNESITAIKQNLSTTGLSLGMNIKGWSSALADQNFEDNGLNEKNNKKHNDNNDFNTEDNDNFSTEDNDNFSDFQDEEVLSLEKTTKTKKK